MNDNKFDLLIFDWEGTLAKTDQHKDKVIHNELYDGIELGIKTLRSQGYILSVATGMGRKSLNQALMDTNLKDHFLITKTVDDCFSKPHPQMILEILNFTMINPKKVLMIGDSGYDFQMADNAGISSLAVSYGVEPLEHLKEFNILDIITDPYELFDWIRING